MELTLNPKKTMKKFFYMAVAAIAALSSCSSDNDAILGEGGNGNNNGAAQVFTGVIEGDATTRTTITAGTGTNKKVEWVNGDEISINGVTYTATKDGSDATKATFAKKTASDADPTATYKACYPASMASGTGSSVTFSLPASYTYEAGKFNMPMYAQSEDTNLSFQNICGVLAIKVTSEEMSKVTKITVTSDKAISGTCTIALSGEKYVATATGTTDADKTVTLNCGTGVIPAAESAGGTTFYLPVPKIETAKLSIVVYGTATKATTDYKNLIYRQDMNASNVTVARNTIYSVNFKTSLAKFTVKAAEGENPAKTVNFTKGNLYWDGSAYHLEAAQNAYDHGTTSGETTTYTSNHVSHFFWTKTAAASYASSYSDDPEAKTDHFWLDGCNKSGTHTHGDAATKIAVDGTSDLYALSGGANGEWKYLINSRDDASNLYKYGVSVTTSAGTEANCLIIAPDGYDYTAHPLKTTYTADEWAAAEALGLVCLPTSGYRYDSYLYDGGRYGCYWSSSPNAYSAYRAYFLYFYSDDVDPASYNRRDYGYSLRLVK